MGKTKSVNYVCVTLSRRRVLGMLADAVNNALAQDYASLWAGGDMTWELGGEKKFGKLMERRTG